MRSQDEGSGETTGLDMFYSSRVVSLFLGGSSMLTLSQNLDLTAQVSINKGLQFTVYEWKDF